MPAQKRTRAAPKTSLQDVKVVLENYALEGTAVGNNVYEELIKAVDIHTPMGDLLHPVQLPLNDGLEYQWVVCNPFAFLYVLCTENAEFASLLSESLRSEGGCKHGSIALYCDETTHGNSQRHDTVNDLQCVYWLISQLPAWFRQRSKGWFYLGVLRADVQHEVKAGLSGIMKSVLHLFFNPHNFNFIRGVRLPLLPDAGLSLVVLTLLCLLGDERGHKYVASTKGSGGILFCSCCKNVIHIDPAKLLGQDYFVHSTCTDMEKIIITPLRLSMILLTNLPVRPGSMQTGPAPKQHLKNTREIVA